MSTAEILSLISLISYIVAGVSAALAVLFWFFFRIPSVIGDLSGHTAKKSIARRRASNERAGGRGYQPSATNANRGKLTSTMQQSRKLNPKPQKSQLAEENQMPDTGVLESNRAEVGSSPQTDLLGSDTTCILTDSNVTAGLQDETAELPKRTGGKELTMLEDIMLIHTDEVIL